MKHQIFGVKNLVKRCWANVIKGTKKIQVLTLLKADIKKLLQLSTINSHDTCLLKFMDAITTNKINLISYKLYQIKQIKGSCCRV